MTQSSARAHPIFDLRSAIGEPPMGRDGGYFLVTQGIIFEHDNPRYRSPATKIGILELENGKWLAQPPSFHVCSTQYDSRDEALRAAHAHLVRRARKYMRNGEGQGTHWNEGFGNRIIEWCRQSAPGKPKKDLLQGGSEQGEPAIGHPGTEIGIPQEASGTADEDQSVGVQPAPPHGTATSQLMNVTAGETATNSDTAARSLEWSASPVATEDLVSCRDHNPRGYAAVNADQLGWGGNRPSSRANRDERFGTTVGVTAGETATNSEEFDVGRELGEAVGDPVELARRLIVRSFMGFGSNAHNGRSTGFRANSNRSGTSPAHDWANYPEALPALIERVRGVIIENRDAVEVMRAHDGPDTLHYVDPPYLPETRSPANKYDLKYRMYRHELTDEQHVALFAALRDLRGMVVLSGYPAALYDGALTDWRRVETAAYADGARERTEVLWLNPACAHALDRVVPALFDLAAVDAINHPPQRGSDGG